MLCTGLRSSNPKVTGHRCEGVEMALVPDVPRGTVDVEGDEDSLDVRIDPAPADILPDEHGVTLLADVMLHARADTVATLLVRAGDEPPLRRAHGARRGRGAHPPRASGGPPLRRAESTLASGETLHLTVMASETETGIAWLEGQAAVGGMGMGGAAEAADGTCAADRRRGSPARGPGLRDRRGVRAGTRGRQRDRRHRRVRRERTVHRRVPSDPPGSLPPHPSAAPSCRTHPCTAPAPVPRAAGNGPARAGSGLPAGGMDGATPVPAVVDAEVPSRVVAGVAFDAVVRLSLEDLAPTAGTARRKTRARFDPSRDIDVAMQLRGLAFADGTPSVITTSLPAKGEDPRRLVFRLVPDAPGRGHITVTFTQPPVVGAARRPGAEHT